MRLPSSTAVGGISAYPHDTKRLNQIASGHQFNKGGFIEGIESFSQMINEQDTNSFIDAEDLMNKHRLKLMENKKSRD